MRNGRLVIDAVGHTYDFAADNRRPEVPLEAYDGFIAWLYGYGHAPLESTEPGYLLTLPEWAGGWTTEELVAMFFEESDIDVVAMHAVNFFNLFQRGANPWEQCKAVKQAAPDRVLLYAAVDPLADKAAEFDKMAENAAGGINGFKFYPVSGLVDAKNAALSWSFGDDLLFEYLEHARSLGVARMAVHKAVPTAPGPNRHDRPDDVQAAAVAFPDMTFEVVHSGWAFLDDCTQQLALNGNIYANLETTASAVVRMPRRFARAVGSLLAEAPDRVLFATGAPLSHPQPVIDAIDAFVMPEDLVQEGLPEFTPELKAAVLGGNMARLHGLDEQAVLDRIANDEFAQRRAAFREDPRPWHRKRERVGTAAVSA
jgi:predicted TIM-barrel fold metal-dependent hydrolase